MATKERKLKKQKLRNNEYYGTQGTFDDLFAKSQSGYTFQDLMKVIESENNILLAYRNIKKNKGSKTRGTNSTNIVDIGKMETADVIAYVRKRLADFKPHSVRRVEIEKYDGRKRPLGIPTIEDRLIQQCILQVLEPICEAKFHKHSYGFRPNRNTHHAIARAMFLSNISDFNFVVDIDIKGFFDNVNHVKLIKQIWSMGIKDKTLLYVIKRILKAPILMPDGKTVIPQKGTPQGGIISPLLANIVLNELDKWIGSQWQLNPIVGKYQQHYNGYSAMKKTGLKEMFIVRYADDFRIFCRTKSAAEKTLCAVKQWLEQRLKLEVSEEKTKIVNLKRQYSEFLGIKMKVRPKGEKLVVESHVCDKAIKRIHKGLKKRIRVISRPKDGEAEAEAIMNYNAFVMGVHNYYKMATHITLDFHEMAQSVSKSFSHFGDRLKRNPRGEVNSAVIREYGDSKQIRFIKNQPIAPIGYVQTRFPLCKKRSIQKYTPEGRAEIHDNLNLNTTFMLSLMRQPLHGRSVQYADNRISLYCAQLGKCAVTGKVFTETADTHCHHVVPRSNGGGDEYGNLVLVCEKVHILIHAKSTETIEKYLCGLSLNKWQMRKINKLRKSAGNISI